MTDRLHDPYAYARLPLLDVTLKQDASAIDEVHEILAPIRDTLGQIAVQPPAASVVAGR